MLFASCSLAKHAQVFVAVGMNAIRSLGLVVISVAASARADLTIVQKVEGPMINGPVTVRIKGDKARIDASAQASTIVNGKTGEMITLMNEQKRYTRITADRARAMMETVARFSGGNMDASKPANLVATGKKETIDGYETEEYVRETPHLKVSYWIAASYPGGAAITKQLEATTPSMWGPAAQTSPDFRGLPGVPLKSIVKLNTTEIVSTVTSIKQEALADSLFEPPPDFQEMKLPDLGGLGFPNKLSQPASSTTPAHP